VANTNLTIEMITQESLAVLVNQLGFTGKVNRQYDSRFAVSGAKIGDVLNVRKPVRYTVSTGQALDIQDAKETSVPVKLDTQNHVDFQFSSQDLALTIDLFRERYISPAVAALANKIDQNGLLLYKQIYNHVGTPATVPSALLTYLQAGAKLDSNAAPKDNLRYAALDPTMQVTLMNSMLAYFNPTGTMSQQFRTGEMGEAGGFRFFMDQNIATHTVGNAVGTPVTNGTTAHGATTVVTDGWTNSSSTTNLKQGDVISITDVYAVNPQSRQSTGSLMQFVVTQDISDTAGGITIPISPTIYLSGAEQNCYCATVPIPSEKAIKVFDTAQAGLAALAQDSTPQGLCFHRDAFCLATADLPKPGGTDMSGRASDEQLGLSIRIIRQYDINTDLWPCRLDILYGWAVLRPELACRVSS
jgi:hypothetical protein